MNGRVAAASVVTLVAVIGTSTGGGSAFDAPRRSVQTTARVHSVHAEETARSRPSSAVRLDPPSDRRRLHLERTITGAISPKSVVAGPFGRVFAQNMMYRHTVTVYGRRGSLLKTIPDTVDLSRFGVPGHPGLVHGAPVEAAVDPNHKWVYVSNYSMYGAGFGPEGNDSCTPSSAAAAGVSRSYVYRINARTLRINDVYHVGMVPKFLAVTPDRKFLLVSNWCSFSLSIVRLSNGHEVTEVPIGAYPRGIAVFRNSQRAYVSVMGGTQLAVVDLKSRRVVRHITVGSGPRHVVLDPRGRFVYVTLNNEGAIVKVDRRTGRVVDRLSTGQDPRTMALAPDGRALYVVNYFSNTVSVVRTSDMSVLQTIATGSDSHPIGVTYNPRGNRVWVALYSGRILVFNAR